eukprot:81966-Pyramimonas_sp.AAC.1
MFTPHGGCPARASSENLRQGHRLHCFKRRLASMDMSSGDVDQLFTLIDTSQDGLITVEEPALILSIGLFPLLPFCRPSI